MKVNETTGEIWLYGIVGSPEIGGDFGEIDVINAIDAMGDKRITVRINSPGGVVDSGIPIFNALRRHAGGVDTVNDGLAASIASVIMLAGESRITTKGSRWMIHRAHGVTMGTAAEMKRYLAQIDAYDKSIEEIYAAVLGDVADLKKWLDDETWFTSAQAVELGFATALEGDAVQPPRMAAWMKNAPPEFIAACAGQPQAVVKPKPLSQKFYSR